MGPFVLIALPACSGVELAPSAASSDTGLTDEGESSDESEGEGEGTAADEGGPKYDLADPDGAACDPWEQDCPPGEKCTYYYDGYSTLTRCVPVDPQAKGPGEPCRFDGDPWGGIDDCAKGSLCAYVDEEGLGTCVELCSGSPEEPVCSDPDAMCQLCENDCPSLCLPTCDPLAPDCAPGFVCAPTQEGPFVCAPGGAPNGAGGFGATCDYANDCEPGFGCVSGELLPSCDGEFCCTAYCDLDDQKAPCPEPLLCRPFDENADQENQDVGVCALP
jgi:hypothetical protein